MAETKAHYFLSPCQFLEFSPKGYNSCHLKHSMPLIGHDEVQSERRIDLSR